jgi:hypothetical protein
MVSHAGPDDLNFQDPGRPEQAMVWPRQGAEAGPSGQTNPATVAAGDLVQRHPCDYSAELEEARLSCFFAPGVRVKAFASRQ